MTQISLDRTYPTLPLTRAENVCREASRVAAAIVTQRFKLLVLCGFSVLVLALSSAQVKASDSLFLPSQKAVSAPAGAADLCQTYGWACASGNGSAVMSAAQLDFAVALNIRVNREVRAISDLAQYGKEEHWALPTSRGGDCEDFALLKKQLLMQAGVNPRHILISTVLDRNQNAHAVLVMRTSVGDYVLDNLDDRILHWTSTGYTFLRMQNPNNPATWTAVMRGGIIETDDAVSTLRQIVARPSTQTTGVEIGY